MICKYLAVFCIVGKARCLPSWSHFPAWEKLLTDRFSLATVLHCLGRGSTVYLLSHVWLFMTSWTVAWQANGNPLQYSCLEKGVTWIKWNCFSSSVCSIWDFFFFFFCFSGVLELLFWTPELPQRYSHLWMIVRICVLVEEDGKNACSLILLKSLYLSS